MAGFFSAPIRAPAVGGYLVGQSGPAPTDSSARFPLISFATAADLVALADRMAALDARITAREGGGA